MKKAAALFLSLLLLLTAVSGLAETAEYVTYSSPNYPYSIGIPADFQLDSDLGGTDMSFTGPYGNINIAVGESGMTMQMIAAVKEDLDQSFFEQYRDAYGITEADFSTYPMEEIGGLTWYHIGLVLEGWMTMDQMMYINEDDGLTYVITLSMLEDCTVREIIGSFTLK